MRGLAPGRGTGIEHTLTGLQVEQIDRQLRRGVLHRDLATVEAGNFVDRPRLGQHYRVGYVGDRLRGDIHLRQSLQIGVAAEPTPVDAQRSEEHTSGLQSLMRISYAVFCLKKKNKKNQMQ